LIFLFT